MARTIVSVAWAGVLLVGLVISLTITFLQINAGGASPFEILLHHA